MYLQEVKSKQKLKKINLLFCWHLVNHPLKKKAGSGSASQYVTDPYYC
jgi:hypothetical protein